MSDIHYYSNYANTRDIDCFFRIGNVAYHFASNGQPIPPFITRNTNLKIQTAVYALQTDSMGDVDVRRDVAIGLIQNEIDLYDTLQVFYEEFRIDGIKTILYIWNNQQDPERRAGMLGYGNPNDQ